MQKQGRIIWYYSLGNLNWLCLVRAEGVRKNLRRRGQRVESRKEVSTKRKSINFILMGLGSLWRILSKDWHEQICDLETNSIGNILKNKKEVGRKGWILSGTCDNNPSKK